MNTRTMILLKAFATIGMFFLCWGFASIVPMQDAYAEQTPIIIKYAHQLPESQPVAKQARFFEKLVKERSNGKVIIEVYPAAQLFGARDLLPAVRKGAVEIAAVVSGPMVGAIPLIEFWDLPFLVKDWDQVHKISVGYPNDIMRKEFEKIGVHYLAEGFYGFVSLSNSKREIKTPEDIKGLKIRSVGPLASEVLQNMGGSAVVMGGEEGYLALARKTCDGSLNGVVSMASRKYYEVQNYMTLINLYFNPIPMLINLSFWNSLPKDVQTLLQECAAESDKFVFNESKNFEETAVKVLEDHGMKVHIPNIEEMAKFREATRVTRESWAKKHGTTAAEIVKWIENLD